MAKQKPRQDESGNPLHPDADSPGHAPESGEPTEMGRSHGRVLEDKDEFGRTSAPSSRPQKRRAGKPRRR